MVGVLASGAPVGGSQGRRWPGSSIFGCNNKAVTSFVCATTYTLPKAMELGIGQPRRCELRKNCPRFSVQAAEMTAWEQGELALIEENIRFDKDTPRPCPLIGWMQVRPSLWGTKKAEA